MSLRRFFSVASLIFLITGCADYSYLRQSINGHWEVMQRKQPIEQMLRDESTSPALKQQLFSILEIRRFAVTELGLPDNESYRSYADLRRPYVVWNVVAVPEFSLRPKLWCYPIVGCLPYRGFYRRSEANRAARALKDQGYDVTVYGVPAYSTLKWFDDPVLNTFGLKSPDKMAALIFHELAHQKLYLKDDSRFNEAFAVAVEEEGVSLYLDHLASPLAKKRYLQQEQRHHQLLALLQETRSTLKDLFARDLPYRQKRAEKRLVMRQFESRYLEVSRPWGDFVAAPSSRFKKFNNARLASINTYYELVPGFRALFAQQEKNFERFYQAVEQLGQLSPTERYRILIDLGQNPARPWQQLVAQVRQ